MNTAEFHYRASWRVAGQRPGAHRGRQAGSGQLFQRLAPLQDHPDPRRMDLRASLTDAGERFWVRLHEQRTAIKVYVVADLSASMGYRGSRAKPQVMADFIDSLALSALRSGDSVGLIGCAETVLQPFCLPATRQIGALTELAGRLRRFKPKGIHARGLQQAARLLPASRCLVFLLSDFHYPLAQLRQTLVGLARHQVVPVVLWDPQEHRPDASGLALMQDPESRAERLIWLRPELRTRLAASQRERKQHFVRLLSEFGRRPLYLENGFDADAVTRYFLSGR